MTALWWAVIVSGLYHGLSPGMGWPLAVSAALMEKSRWSLVRALGAMALGHFAAMAVILLPFSLMLVLVQWDYELRLGAGLLVIALGIYLLINRRHPRFLARVRPKQLALWSFLAAMAHGAGLMLVPVYLGICAAANLEPGHQAAQSLMMENVTTALVVALAHTFAMTFAGGAIAVAIYAWLGLRFISYSWFNLDIAWALSLIGVGGFGIWAAVAGH